MGMKPLPLLINHSSSSLELASADNFYKYEILESSNHELVHGQNNKGKICAIDKTKLDEGTYTLKVYTDDFVITSDITISMMMQQKEVFNNQIKQLKTLKKIIMKNLFLIFALDCLA